MFGTALHKQFFVLSIATVLLFLLTDSTSVAAGITNIANLAYLNQVLSHPGSLNLDTDSNLISERYRNLLSWQSNYPPARRSLGRLLVLQRKWPEALENYIPMDNEAIQTLLAALWQSLAVRPGTIDDPRYDHLCTLMIRWLAPRDAALSLIERAGLLRCMQWLGHDAEVVEISEIWLRQNMTASALERSLIACLLAESTAKHVGLMPESEPTLDCVLPFEGVMSITGQKSEQTMPIYPVGQTARDGQFVIAVAVNTLDLNLGLPVATHYYWSSAPLNLTENKTPVAVNVTSARLVNFVPNAGFMYEQFLGLPLTSVMPIGYERDIYGALPSTRSIIVAEIDDVPGAFLSLSNPDGQQDTSSGLASYPFPVDSGSVYIQGGLVRNQQGGLHLGRYWYTSPPVEKYDYVIGNYQLADWTRVAALTFPPHDAQGAACWVLNYNLPGSANFAQLLILLVPDLFERQSTR